jgi:NAD(P)-dependent dehydrogenase (short-subunit alcohol dehydrogenase family)
MNMETTHNKVRSVAITGAGSGLGREVATGFADKGYRVDQVIAWSAALAPLRRATTA